ncbi:EamA family transporter [Jeotgalibacillus soli]|uniref:Transport protein YwfM n=1 Tax=Jeotgalibacillus soli TaxID=889306 RepID=A0A0C2RGA8_9BACL|nr:EamA family transporter [Jeotgalibacillus soli]KIL49235.1 transport protein YwfM [Jeotgalibacillus soli]
MLRSKYPLFPILFAAILWGTTGTAHAFAPPSAHPISFGAMRLAFGGTTLLLFVLLQGKLVRGNWSIKHVVLAALSMALYQPFFFSAVSVTGIAVGTVVAIGSAPIVAGIMEWMINRRKPSLNWWVATLIAIVGCFMLFANQNSVVVDPLGILLALGAGLSFASYTIISKELLHTQSPDTVVAVVFTVSALFLAPLLFIFDLSWLFEFEGLAMSLYLGVFATAVAYLLFAKGLVKIPASTAVTLSLAEPLTAALLGVFLVGESLSLLAWGGVGLLFLAIIVLSVTPKNKLTKDASGYYKTS